MINKEGGGYSASLPTKTDLRKAMEEIWADIVFIERGKRFATICLGFNVLQGSYFVSVREIMSDFTSLDHGQK